MKKISLLLGAIILAFCSVLLVSCGGSSTTSSSSSSSTATTPDPSKQKIVMITDTGDINDKSFNQGTWEGIQNFYKQYPSIPKPQYIKPTDKSDAGYEQAITTAISDDNANIIVTPGYMFDKPVSDLSQQFPDVKFIILDAKPAQLQPNTYSIMFKEEQSGFLAGYAAVADGLNKLGFIGGIAVPAVVHYAVGYIAGIYQANKDLNKTATIDAKNYYYANQFTPDPKFQTTATSWFNSDNLDVIFAAAGGVGTNVIQASNDLTDKGQVKYTIGVDSDQAYLGKSVITSAIKNLQVATFNALEGAFSFNGKSYKGGQAVLLGLSKDANNVGLSPLTQDGWRFKNFTLDQYKQVADKIISGEIKVPNDVAGLKTFIQNLGATLPTDLLNEIVPQKK